MMKEFFDRLLGRKRERERSAEARFETLAHDLASGKKPPPADEVEALLVECGTTPEELEARVHQLQAQAERKARREQLRAELAGVEKDLPAARDEEKAAVQNLRAAGRRSRAAADCRKQLEKRQYELGKALEKTADLSEANAVQNETGPRIVEIQKRVEYLHEAKFKAEGNAKQIRRSMKEPGPNEQRKRIEATAREWDGRAAQHQAEIDRLRGELNELNAKRKLAHETAIAS